MTACCIGQNERRFEYCCHHSVYFIKDDFKNRLRGNSGLGSLVSTRYFPKLDVISGFEALSVEEAQTMVNATLAATPYGSDKL